MTTPNNKLTRLNCGKGATLATNDGLVTIAQFLSLSTVGNSSQVVLSVVTVDKHPYPLSVTLITDDPESILFVLSDKVSVQSQAIIVPVSGLCSYLKRTFIVHPYGRTFATVTRQDILRLMNEGN